MMVPMAKRSTRKYERKTKTEASYTVGDFWSASMWPWLNKSAVWRGNGTLVFIDDSYGNLWLARKKGGIEKVVIYLRSPSISW